MKTWILVAVVALFAVVAIQNAGVVTVRFLFWNASLSHVVLLLVTFAAGVVVGFGAAELRRGAALISRSGGGGRAGREATAEPHVERTARRD
jgi:hypothetical protein